MASTRSISVPVVGGDLYGEVTGPEPREGNSVVLLLPDLASNAVSWRLVTARLPDSVSTIAVDLRGRGRSADLPDPFGLAAHLHDLSTTLAYLGAAESHLGVSKQIVVVGHGFGAFVARALAQAESDRVAGYIGVDGGVAFGVDTVRQAGLEADLETAVDRIHRSYGTREDALAAARAASWGSGRSTALLDAVVGHELRGSAPSVRFATNVDAIWADGQELLAESGPEASRDGEPILGELLRAGLASPWSDASDRWSGGSNVVVVPGMDHDDLLHHPQGADAVARSIIRMLTSGRAAPSRPS